MSHDISIWRPAPLSMLAVGLLGGAFGVVVALIGFGVLESDPPMSLGGNIAYVVVGLVALAVTWRLTLGQCVVVRRTDLVVVNVLRTTVIPLVDLETLHPSRYGLMIIWNRDGRSVQTCASAVQKAAIPEQWRRRPARADRLVEVIQQQCERAQSG